MTDYALVLNAGSSSLKFCVFARPEWDWRLESRGQIEGIGTSPRIYAKNGEGQVLVDRKPDKVRDGRDALDELASWLKSMYAAADCTRNREGSGCGRTFRKRREPVRHAERKKRR